MTLYFLHILALAFMFFSIVPKHETCAEAQTLEILIGDLPLIYTMPMLISW
jgi:hypothetical protein